MNMAERNLMNRQRALVGVGLSILLLAGCSHAPVQNSVQGLAASGPVAQIPGYLTAPDGTPAVNADGQCWRTADWRPILAIEACDPVIARGNQAVREQLGLALSAVASPDTSVFDAAPVPAAAVVEPAPSPAAPVAPSADMVTKPVVLNTDAAFFFGKDRLTQAGRDAVENLAAYIKLWGIEGVQVEITGHTDRIGNARDNQGLSVRRAQAVRQVMIEAGVSADAVSARGVGSTEPVTGPDDCPNDLVRCDLINCLAPDRRVEVRLKGTRKAPVR